LQIEAEENFVCFVDEVANQYYGTEQFREIQFVVEKEDKLVLKSAKLTHDSFLEA